MKKSSNQNISVLFLTFVAFLIVGSATLSFQTANAYNPPQTVNAQNTTVTTGNATTADNATGVENATAVGSISSNKLSVGSDDGDPKRPWVIYSKEE